jgi:hypothetical protein
MDSHIGGTLTKKQVEVLREFLPLHHLPGR